MYCIAIFIYKAIICIQYVLNYLIYVIPPSSTLNNFRIKTYIKKLELPLICVNRILILFLFFKNALSFGNL